MAKKLIAITGGIGSGKSLALSILLDAGFYVLSSDDICAKLYERRKVKLILKKLFPSAVKGFFNPKIDRKAISKIVFSDKQKLKDLTDTITPLVIKEIKEKAKKISDIVFVEVPILFECGYQNDFDAVIVIYRPLNERIESVKTRSNLTENEVKDRIKNQFDYENNDLSSYILLTNDGDKEQLKASLLSIIKNL